MDDLKTPQGPPSRSGFFARQFDSRFGGVLFLGLVILALNFLLRTALLIASFPAAHPGFLDILRIYGVGLLYDVATFLCMMTPVVLVVALTPQRLWRSAVNRAGTLIFTFLVLFLMLFDVAAEWFFWQEFSSRFNFIAVDYLIYTNELVGNIDESYPARTIIGCLLAAALVGTWLSRKVMLRSCRATGPWGKRLRFAGAYVGLATLSLLFVRPSLADRTDNQYVNDLSRNGVYSLVAAFRDNSLEYGQFYLTRDRDRVFDRLRELLRSQNNSFLGADGEDLIRRIRYDGPAKDYNVVLFTVESLDADFLGVFGNRQGLTPCLDELSKESLLFTRVYASGTRTVRGLEAIAMSIPPTPGYSVVKRPDHGTVFTLTGLFKKMGYDVAFLYGGFGYFDNMNSFFSANGCRIVDRASLSKDEISFATIWGVCDEDLYDRVLKEADASNASGKPFFHMVMTTSNHRPYAYPQKIDIPSGSGRDGAVKYTDYAFGQFFRKARTKPWFDRTLFVIVADHCANSAGKTEVPVERYHIPLFLYGPKIVPPGRCDTLCGQLDLAPTILGILNVSYVSKFFGKDVLHSPPNRALLGTYQKLGLYVGDTLTVLSPGDKAAAYRVHPDGTQTRIDLDEALLFDAISYYQGASYLIEHRLFTQN